MKGIDTNVLVRYIVQDDRQQSLKATHFIEKECSVTSPAFINPIILCELVWVLESAYGYEKKAISDLLSNILRTKQFCIYQPEIVWQALRGYRDQGADFSDNYIACFNANNNCENTMTFDKKASRLENCKLLD